MGRMNLSLAGFLAISLAVSATGVAPQRAIAAARATDVTLVLPAATAPVAHPAALEEPPQLVEITLTQAVSLGDLLRQGLDVVSVRGTSAQLLARAQDAARFERLGVTPRVIDAHPGATAAARTRAELASRSAPGPTRVWSATGRDGRFSINVLPAFGSGSMGGYWTAAEIKMKLDELVANDTQNLVANKIDTVGYSREGRPIWGLKISKAVGGADSRPVVFYNALTHCREPEGMQALFYFVSDVLAKYGSDPLATYLLDRRVIYIVPLVNPDGYAVNQATYTGSGGALFGFWRKNTRDNNNNGLFDSASDGVDLNRNFGYLWGLNDTGSSPDSNSEIYRGPAAFSELETQAQRNLVSSLKPVTGFSFHTFADLLTHPWNHTTTPTPDASAFAEWSDALSRDNAYLTGVAPAILYEVNGDFNDWVYGDTVAKPRGFTWTPEVGDNADGFWPPPSRIVPLAQEMLRPCYVLAALAGPFVQDDGFTLLEGTMNMGRLTNVVVAARNMGARGTTGIGLIGTMVALDAGAHVLNGTIPYPAAAPRQTVAPLGASAFQVALDDTVTPGRLMRFEVAFTSSDGFGRDTIVVPAGTPTLLVADGASNGVTGWQIATSNAWSVVTNDATHASAYFAEKGIGNYFAGANDRMILRMKLNLSAGVHAYAFYDAKWEYEQDYDSGSIETSLDSTIWTPMRATGTTPGSGGASSQAAGLPFYAGNRRNWKPEIADLSSRAGPTQTSVYLRLRGQADSGSEYDGFAFDSLRIVIYNPAAQPTPVAVAGSGLPARLALAAPVPNPMRGFTRLEMALPRAGVVRLEILDVMGRRVRTLANGTFAAGRYVHGWNGRDQRGSLVRPGVYLARLAGPGGEAVRRLVVFE